MRIEVISTVWGPRFYWHTIGCSHIAWVLFLPQEHAGERLTIHRQGALLYSGKLEASSFGPITCFKIANAQMLGIRHPKLYAALFQVGDLLKFEPVPGMKLHLDYRSCFWSRLQGSELLPQAPYVYGDNSRELESAA